MSVSFTLMSKNATGELRELIEAHLTAQYEKQLDEIGAVQKTWHPTRSAGFAGCIMLFLLGGMAVFVFMQPVPDNQRSAFWMVVAMFALMGGFFLWATIHAVSRTLTISSEGLTDRTLFRTRQIPFSKITSVMSRDVHYKGRSWEVTTLEGNRQKISLTSQMDDYPLMIAFIHKNVAQPATERGEIAAIELKSKQEKQSRILFPIFALIYFIPISSFGVWSIQDANKHLARYSLMETQGRTTTGQITGRETKGSKTTRYILDFAFDAGGTRIDSASPVSCEDYDSTRVGDTVSIIFVPDHPDICRLVESTGKQRAESDLRTGYIMLISICILAPLLGLSPFFKRRKTSG